MLRLLWQEHGSFPLILSDVSKAGTMQIRADFFMFDIPFSPFPLAVVVTSPLLNRHAASA